VRDFTFTEQIKQIKLFATLGMDLRQAGMQNKIWHILCNVCIPSVHFYFDVLQSM